MFNQIVLSEFSVLKWFEIIVNILRLLDLYENVIVNEESERARCFISIYIDIIKSGERHDGLKCVGAIYAR